MLSHGTSTVNIRIKDNPRSAFAFTVALHTDSIAFLSSGLEYGLETYRPAPKLTPCNVRSPKVSTHDVRKIPCLRYLRLPQYGILLKAVPFFGSTPSKIIRCNLWRYLSIESLFFNNSFFLSGVLFSCAYCKISVISLLSKPPYFVKFPSRFYKRMMTCCNFNCALTSKFLDCKNIEGVEANPQSNTLAPVSDNAVIAAFEMRPAEIRESCPTATTRQSDDM